MEINVILTNRAVETWREECADHPQRRLMIFAEEWRELCDLALKGLTQPEAVSINPLQMALDSEEFYELSQAYRHAKDQLPREAGEPDPVTVAWENLKRYIIDNSQVVDRRDIIEECWQALDSLIARGELPEPQRERRNGLIIACNQLFDMGAYGRGKESREPQDGDSK